MKATTQERTLHLDDDFKNEINKWIEQVFSSCSFLDPEPRTERGKPSLGKLSASEVTDSSARLSWDVPAGSFNSFLIQYKDTEGKPKSLPVEGDAREATISHLVPSRKYKFNLYGLVDRKRFGPVSTEIVTGEPQILDMLTSF